MSRSVAGGLTGFRIFRVLGVLSALGVEGGLGLGFKGAEYIRPGGLGVVIITTRNAKPVQLALCGLVSVMLGPRLKCSVASYSLVISRQFSATRIL